ncbi:SPOR domain-containing protein [Roseovarius indicus]|uniref:Cell division protein FtsN n=1 Tax=Roseovarius indicus TaxID=540747 RepID=A0A0T5PD17_9RHOB|nr:SPOR domain-containing protein [Roseovarius indicus]KRS19177.1 sporulation domain-containing protein [Roseovarius indicus]OAO06773.1 sporulation domain-containing protein [Roseovarius indicus]QEW25863.1 cell division protein FtsN [Roseovarius indicus]SFD89496.1 Sporulation related domain-containing protein [Roseovarius indicus]
MAYHTEGRRLLRAGTAIALAGGLALGGCGEGTEGGTFGFLKPKADTAEAADMQDTSTTKLVERDVEAPEVFQVTDSGLWDGRPSLGGVWVAHPDVKEPERVIIRNTKNSKFVIGALFRRERNNPGPSIQVSSDAASALGMLAGAPAQLNVTALRREAQPTDAEEVAEAPATDLTAPESVEATTLDPVSTATAAIEEAEATPPTPEPKPKPPQTSSLDKPYLQIGIFSVEENALNTAEAMRQNGMVPTVKKQSAKGKTFWRVIVGPAANKAERSALLRKVKGVGFADAYPVTN